jgi:hypothetical protein
VISTNLYIVGGVNFVLRVSKRSADKKRMLIKLSHHNDGDDISSQSSALTISELAAGHRESRGHYYIIIASRQLPRRGGRKHLFNSKGYILYTHIRTYKFCTRRTHIKGPDRLQKRPTLNPDTATLYLCFKKLINIY